MFSNVFEKNLVGDHLHFIWWYGLISHVEVKHELWENSVLWNALFKFLMLWCRSSKFNICLSSIKIVGESSFKVQLEWWIECVLKEKIVVYSVKGFRQVEVNWDGFLVELPLIQWFGGCRCSVSVERISKRRQRYEVYSLGIGDLLGFSIEMILPRARDI